MAYWENGRCHVFGSGQSQSFNMPVLARLIDEPVENIHYVGEFCGGGFGSKGRSYPVMAIPPLMSKKINRPVMMRISREEEYYLGIARGGLQGRARLGFREDGRIIAADIYLVQDAGPTPGFWDYRAAAEYAAVTYTRWPCVCAASRFTQHDTARTAAWSGAKPDGQCHGAPPRQGPQGVWALTGCRSVRSMPRFMTRSWKNAAFP
ncbi:MAG: hypothetical protein CM1200mP36_03370 [Gammaproteobacteria bacterium]|nr:MAG: hypothetical protein CM1200mP36_03370 [Gammaproteobacteria bacterium]